MLKTENGMGSTLEPSSFRDPAGAVFRRNNTVYRQINRSYQAVYEYLMHSGLYEALVAERLLVPHKQVDVQGVSEDAACIIQPKRIDFISYPYEWCFSQYRQAALATLRIHQVAMRFGMVLKDASVYNIQFIRGQAVLIDTLSFEMYPEGSPWLAYGQFCRHFLAPLLLMARVDVRLNQLMKSYIDGIPLDLAAKLLKGKGGAAAWQHITLHARFSDRHSEDGKKGEAGQPVRLSKERHLALIDSLQRIVEKLSIKAAQTEWGEYTPNVSYSEGSAEKKKELVARFISQAGPPDSLWDLGANDGTFSRLALAGGAHVVAFDFDHTAVEQNYAAVRKEKSKMLPLLLDLNNPSPSIGFANGERVGIAQRGRPGAIMMLAVIHHLAISNNVPFDKIAEWTSGMSDRLIIEFVPKDDQQVQLLLKTREDIFPHYDSGHFEKVFSKYYTLVLKEKIEGSGRELFLFEKRAPR